MFPVLLLITLSCQQEVNKSTQNCCLSSEDSLRIIKEIIAVTDTFVEASNNMDADKAAEFYDSSSDFKFAENGEQYTNWDSHYDMLKDWYSQPLESVEFTWDDINVIQFPKRHPIVIRAYGELTSIF